MMWGVLMNTCLSPCMSVGEGSYKESWVYAQTGRAPRLPTVCNCYWYRVWKREAQHGLCSHALQQTPGSHQTWEPRLDCREWAWTCVILMSHTPASMLSQVDLCLLLSLSRWDQRGENIQELDELSRSQSTCSPHLRVSVFLPETLSCSGFTFMHSSLFKCLCVRSHLQWSAGCHGDSPALWKDQGASGLGTQSQPAPIQGCRRRAFKKGKYQLLFILLQCVYLRVCRLKFIW